MMSTKAYIGALPEIIDSIPEIKQLDFPEKDRVITFIERKIQKLNIKINTSHFMPCEHEDILNLNHDFDGAVKNWLIQFPKEYRLGALLTVLGTIYITEAEFNSLLQIAIQKLIEAVKIKAEKSSLGPKLSTTSPTPYTFSNNLVYKKYTYMTNTSGTLDGNQQFTVTTDLLSLSAFWSKKNRF